MLYTKFQCHFGVLKVFTTYGCGGHIGHVTGRFEYNFVSDNLKATHEIWLQLAKWLLQRCLTLSDYGKS